MILERSREFTVNMGNYESVKVGARVTVNSDELTIPEGMEAFAFASSYADQLLTDALADDVKEATELTGTRDSFVLSWGVK